MAWQIQVVSVGFPLAYPQPPMATVTFTKAQLAWAAITVGRPDKNAVKRHGRWATYEALFRWNMILANLDLSSVGGTLRHSPAFHALDATEKGGVNFYLGMVFAKLFADKLLDIPWLHHFDHFQLGNVVAKKAGKRKPDFVGLRASDASYHIVEAKARTPRRMQSALDHAKSQAQEVLAVNGSPPATSIGALLYPVNGDLQFEWHDPEPSEVAAFELKETREVWEAYYRLPLALTDLPEADKLAFRRLTGLTVELDPEMAEAARTLSVLKDLDDWQEPREHLIELSKSRSVRGDFAVGAIIQSDGIIVTTDDDQP